MSVLCAGSSRSHCVVYLMVAKSFPDGKVEYGKLCLVRKFSGIALYQKLICTNVNRILYKHDPGLEGLAAIF